MRISHTFLARFCDYSLLCFFIHFCFVSFTFLLPRLYQSTPGCNTPSVSSIVLCLLLSCSRWFPPSLLCRLAIFYLVVPLISSLSLVATLCSIWSTYCSSFLLYVRVCFSVYSMSIIFVLFLISEHGILSCSFRPNIFL